MYPCGTCYLFLHLLIHLFIPHSISDYEATLSKTYMERVNQEFAKAGVRGISILFASGQCFSVSSFRSLLYSQCFQVRACKSKLSENNSFEARLCCLQTKTLLGDNGAGCKETTHDHYIYNPMFPSSSPFVTTIGGTVFDNPFEIIGE